MKKAPLISVIIPVKGRLHFVREAIDSVYRQNYFQKENIEIIIVEEKNYRYLIGKRLKKYFPQIIILQNRGKEGPGGSRNTGLETATGKYILFLDSDDRLKGDFIQILADELERDKKCSSVVCFSNAVFSKDYPVFERIKLYLLMIIRDISLLVSYVFNKKYLIPSMFYLCQISHMMFKRESISNLRFNYDYRRGGEDWDFFIRTMSSDPVRITLKRLLIFRYSQNSSTSSPLNRKLKWQSYSKLATKLPDHIKKSLYCRLFLSYIAIFQGNND